MFHRLSTVALSSGQLQLALAPGTFTSLINLRDSFELYRFVKLRYRLHPAVITADTAQVVGYYPEGTVTSPSFPSATADCVAMASRCTVPSIWHEVAPARLQGIAQWYKSNPDSADIDLEWQGIINVTGTSSENAIIEMDGVCEFKNPIDPTAAMSAMRQRVYQELKTQIAPPTPGGK